MGSQKVLVLNPVSGSADHAELVQDLAEEHGFEVRKTQDEGDAISIAEEAVEEGAKFLAAAGGDGTLNEAVRGIYNTSRINDVTFGVVPTGTGNNFAGNIGLQGIEHAFRVLENGERRTIDIGTVKDSVERPFLNSCVGGLTADASEKSRPEEKKKWGVLAYVMSTLGSINDFDSMRLHVDTPDDIWTGDALIVMVGNGRRFPAQGRTQANMEDGKFDVTIIEDKPKAGLMGEVALKNMLGGETPNITSFKASSIELSVLSQDELSFSLDGEMLATDRLEMNTEERCLTVPVGRLYQPDPDASSFKRLSRRIRRTFL